MINGQDDPTSFLFDTFYSVKDQFFLQKRQVIQLAEQMIYKKDLSYISKIFSLFYIADQHLPNLDDNSRSLINLPRLDADMRRLLIICEIMVEEKRTYESKILFLEQVSTFNDLMQKYVRITFLLRRMEFPFSKEVLEETFFMLKEEQVSPCALRKITEYEVFINKEYIYSQALKIKEQGGTLK